MLFDNVCPGWVFYGADFSSMATHKFVNEGTVTLKRDIENTELWNQLSSDIKHSDQCPELYVRGQGKTIEEAIFDANKNAKAARAL